MRLEVRVAGFGGQGIIRAGLILAMAASLFEDKNAVQTQSYGPESRGGSCKSEVVISDEEIDFPKALEPDVLLVMSQAAYTRYADALKNGGTLIFDPYMIPQQKEDSKIRVYPVPATSMAEEMGKTIFANVIMLGALTAITTLVSGEAMKKAILSNIPKGTEKLNLEAYEKGYEYGRKLLAEQK
ncbi:MAG TPA: 2-oxoacid:ferredoxin oxidoreductase subunit gamma [Candidatus Bathyarchaeia archaeon]|nr:2-oxoacid:ferredoxin oxidoreductase subunit gamma [Candidatus Bathyarchaeia archaeon]